MPQVPTVTDYSATGGLLPNVSQQAPENATRMGAALGYGAEQEKALGEASQAIGGTAADIQAKVQEQANMVRVQDALNQANQAAINAKFDPQSGYLQQKGQQALQRDSGVPLATEYTKNLSDQIGEISNNLGNDAQKRLFGVHAGTILTQFNEGVQTHVNQQFQEYSQSVAKGAVDLASQSAALNWQNPQAIDQAVEQAKTGIRSMLQGQLPDATTGSQGGQGGQGASANMVTSAMNVAESSIRSKVIDSALENNNPTYAMAYFNKFKNSMTADDILSVQAKLNTQVDQHVAMSAVMNTTQNNLHLLAPTTSDRAFNLATGGVAKAFQVAVGTESSGQQTGGPGSVAGPNEPTTSPKGAIGIAQVMPTTGPEAAKLAGVDWDADKFKNDANYNYKLGLAYFNKQVTDFGGIDKGFAAYNAGPGALQKALDQSKADDKPMNWLSYLPKETQDYVNKNTQSLQAGGGVPVPPTKQEFVAAALSPDVIGTDPRPQVVTLIREQAEKQYDLMVASRKEQGENALQTAQRALDINGGNMSQLTPQQMSDVTNYAPDKVADLYKYAKSIASPAQPTNIAAYADAVTYPDKLAHMTDSDFATYLKTNFSPGRDQDHIAMVRADAISGKGNNSAESLNSGALKGVLDQRLNSIGIAPNPKGGSDDAQQVAIIRKYVADDIFQQQGQLGRKMTVEEMSKRIDHLFSSQSVTAHWWQSSPKTMMAMTSSNIPDDDLTQITSALTKQGITKPSDEQIMRTYWNWKK